MLGRMILICSLFTATTALSDYGDYIDQYSKLYKVNPAIVKAMVFVESSGRKNVVGDDGLSVGLMQIQLGTARDMGFEGTLEQLKIARLNLRYGIKYVRYLLEEFNGDYHMALDAYNRGLKNVVDYPFEGDYYGHRYVGKILRYLDKTIGEDGLIR